MDNFGMLETIRQVGPGSALAITILAMMFWLIKRIMRDHQEERKSYQIMISNHMSSNTEAMKTLANEIKDRGRTQQEANRYVREEHHEILKALMKMNGKQ